MTTQLKQPTPARLYTTMRRIRHIHFIGIGGVGMCGIAEVLHNLGYVVSGSDLHANVNTERLMASGVRCYSGHAAEHIQGADAVGLEGLDHVAQDGRLRRRVHVDAERDVELPRLHAKGDRRQQHDRSPPR